MAAPEFVPASPVRRTPKAYTSPPRRTDSWRAERPGDLGGERQPTGIALGVQGPDQGYALRLAERFVDRLELAAGEDADDAVAVGVAVAIRRASLFGRAPVPADLEVAFTLLGYLGEPAPDDLVAWRRRELAQLASPHHYFERRHVVNQVPEPLLRKPPAAAGIERVADWRKTLGA